MYVAIEGTVGAGKTTLMKCLQQKTCFAQWQFAFEPVEQYQKLGKLNPLAMAYADPARHAFCSHLHIMTLVAEQFSALSRRVKRGFQIIVERCHLSPAVFALAHAHRETFDELQTETSQELFQHMLGSSHLEFPDYFVFIMPSFKCVQERVRMRSRHAESKSSESFFLLLNIIYNSFAKMMFRKYPDRVFILGQEIANRSVDYLCKYVSNLLRFLSGEKERRLLLNKKKNFGARSLLMSEGS